MLCFFLAFAHFFVAMEHVGPAKIRLRARSAVPLLHLRHVAAKDSKLITDDCGFVGGAKMPLDEHDELLCP